MRLIVISDPHADWTTMGVDRFPEIAEAAHAAADVAIAEGAEAFLMLGDLCNPDSGSCVFRAVGLAVEIAVKLYSRGISSIWLAGNHDTIENSRGETSLTPLRALENLPERPDGAQVYVVESPSAIDVAERDGTVREVGKSVRFACLPFTATSHGYDVAAALEQMCEGTAKKDVVVLSHLSIPGLQPGEETTDMARGREVVLPVALAVAKSAMVLQGHYHRQQVTPDGIWIAGSLARLTFAPGVHEHRPGFLRVVI